jgi:predicted small integral membrane protein
VLAATGTKNEPQVAAFFLTVLALIVDMAMDTAEKANRPVRPRLLAVLVFFLYGLGTKPYMLHLMPGALVVGALLAGVRPALQLAAGLPLQWLREARAATRAAQIGTLLLVGAALLLGLYWYGRNEVLKGNPVFPYGISLAGNQVEEAQGETFHFDLRTLSTNLRLLSEKFGDKQRRISPDLPDTTGWGWVAYGMGFPALAWAVLRFRRFRILAVGFVLSGLILLLSTRNSPWNMRYTAWFPAVTSLALGASVDVFARPTGRRLGVVLLLFAGCLALNFSATVNYNLVKTDQLRGMLARSFLDRQAAYLRVYVPYEYENALVHVPREALLGYNVGPNGFIYPLFRADFSQRLVYIPIQADEACSEIAASMARAGTRHLVVAPEQTEDEILSLLHQCGEDGTVLRELGVNLYVTR